MRVLILYTELAEYVTANIREFVSTNPQTEFLVVHYPVNAEAPFKFNEESHIQFIIYQQDSWSKTSEMCKNFSPDVVLCSGWSNRDYIAWISTYNKPCAKVLCFDNVWKNTFKQKILSTLSPFTFLRHFTHAWVAGNPQADYASRLGFKKNKIYTGLYLADKSTYQKVGINRLENIKAYPKVFISISRYVPQKDLPTLWNAFIAANKRVKNKWKLKCYGFGELFEQRILNEDIEHLGFMPANVLQNEVLNAGVFILPSTEEPWGVAVNEMALSAMPMVLSDKIGAASMFLKNSNGFTFRAGNAKELEDILVEIMECSDAELINMAKSSYNLAMKAHESDWNIQLNSIYNSVQNQNA